MENVEIQGVEARRSFMKKMAYVAPAVMALGALNAQASVAGAASVFIGEARVNPGDKLIGVSTVTGYSGPDVIESGTYQRVYADGTLGDLQTFTGAQVQDNNMGVFTWAKSFFANIFA